MNEVDSGSLYVQEEQEKETISVSGSSVVQGGEEEEEGERELADLGVTSHRIREFLMSLSLRLSFRTKSIQSDSKRTGKEEICQL